MESKGPQQRCCWWLNLGGATCFPRFHSRFKDDSPGSRKSSVKGDDSWTWPSCFFFVDAECA